jgi:hypothetical protein
VKIGFTGTREGMTDVQEHEFRAWVQASPRIAEFHHGCCIGADEQAVNVIREELGGSVVVHGHPGDWPPLTSKEAVATSHPMHPCRPNLERNRLIVEACEVLIACPKGPEELRSGTWATVRAARYRRKHIVIILPNGLVTEELPKGGEA